MQTNSVPGAAAQPNTLAYAHTLKGVKKALLNKPVRYHARPLFAGDAVTIVVNEDGVEVTPHGIDVFGENGLGIDLIQFRGCTVYLETYQCDTIRFDARMLAVEGGQKPVIDFFRMTLLKDGVATHQKLIHPEFPDGRDGGLQRQYVEIQKSNAALQLDFAKGRAPSIVRQLGPPYVGVTAAVDGMLWASEQTIDAPTFLIPV